MERLRGSPVEGSFRFLPCLLESLMVQLMSYGKLRPDSELPIKKLPAPVKVETEDQLEDEHGPPDKRFKMARPPPPPQQVDLSCSFSSSSSSCSSSENLNLF